MNEVISDFETSREFPMLHETISSKCLNIKLYLDKFGNTLLLSLFVPSDNDMNNTTVVFSLSDSEQKLVKYS